MPEDSVERRTELLVDQVQPASQTARGGHLDGACSDGCLRRGQPALDGAITSVP